MLSSGAPLGDGKEQLIGRVIDDMKIRTSKPCADIDNHYAQFEYIGPRRSHLADFNHYI